MELHQPTLTAIPAEAVGLASTRSSVELSFDSPTRPRHGVNRPRGFSRLAFGPGAIAIAGMLGLLGTASACGMPDGSDSDGFGTFASGFTDGTGSDGEEPSDAEADDTAGDAGSESDSGDAPTSGDDDGLLDDGGEMDATGGDGNACLDSEYAWTPVRAQLVFVLDYSGSMSTGFEDLDGIWSTRWAVLHDLVVGIIAEHGSRFEFGAKVFPWPAPPTGTPDAACAVSPQLEAPIDPDGDALLAAIPTPGSLPLGQTPMGKAIDAAGSALLAADPTRPRALVLIADGGVSTSCGPTESYEGMALKLDGWRLHEDIQTFVVGVGVISSVAEELESLTGGEPVYAPSDALQLQAALDDVVKATASCEVQLDESPTADALIARLDDELLDSTSRCLDRGYRYDVASATVERCASACADYLDGAALLVETPCHEGCARADANLLS